MPDDLRSVDGGREQTARNAAAVEGQVIEGLDGATPLGFLAGIGLQRVLTDDAAARQEAAPRLSWRHLDGWRPVLHGPGCFEDVVDIVHADAQAWESAPALQFRYVKLEKNGPKPVGALNAPVAVLRAWLLQRRANGDDISLRYACALMAETASEPVKAEKLPSEEQLAEHGIALDHDAPLERATMPTFFDFTSRNAQFLAQIDAIRAHLDRDTVEAGLRDGRPDSGVGRTMDWDLAADTPGAIYTGYERGFLPAAEWLAFRGLVCFPVAGTGARLETTACRGRRKSGTFVWPLWDVPAGPATVRSLVARRGLEGLGSEQRSALGIAAVWRAELTKKADGYSGMFSPPEPV